MIDIDKLEQLEKAATPGPWTYSPIRSGAVDVNRGWALRGPDTRRIFWDDTGSGASIEGDDADIDLVLTMRNSLPELLAEVRRLRRIEQAAKDAVIDFFSDGERLLLRADMARVQGGYPRYTRLWADDVKALFDAVHSRTE